MFRGKIENWYDSSMDRLTGTLKVKYTRRFTMISAIIVTLLVNADTIEIAKYLYNNPEARAKVAAKAYQTSADDDHSRHVRSNKGLPAAYLCTRAKLGSARGEGERSKLRRGVR